MLLASDGRVLANNSLAASLLLSANEPQVGPWLTSNSVLIGRNLVEILPSGLGAERAAIAGEALQTAQSICLEGMVRGRLISAVYRPLGLTLDGVACVLLVLRTSPGTVSATVTTRQAVHQDHGALAKLTAREIEILRHIGLGLSTADIAKRLDRSVKTVEWHRVALGEKLGVNNRVELARIVIAAGLVSPHSVPAANAATGVTAFTRSSPVPAQLTGSSSSTAASATSGLKTNDLRTSAAKPNVGALVSKQPALQAQPLTSTSSAPGQASFTPLKRLATKLVTAPAPAETSGRVGRRSA